MFLQDLKTYIYRFLFLCGTAQSNSSSSTSSSNMTPRFPLLVFDPLDEELPCVVFPFVNNRELLEVEAFARVEEQSSSSSSSIMLTSSSDDTLEKRKVPY